MKKTKNNVLISADEGLSLKQVVWEFTTNKDKNVEYIFFVILKFYIVKDGLKFYWHKFKVNFSNPPWCE